MALPPGLAGFVQGQQLGNQNQYADLQQATGLMAIMSRLRQQQQDDQIKGVLAQSGGDIEKAIPALMRFGPQGIQTAQHLAQTSGTLADLVQKRNLTNFNTRLSGGEFNNPSVEAIPAGLDELGGGPGRPAMAGGLNVRNALEAKVKAGLLDPLAYQKELDAINKPIAVGRGGLAAKDASGNYNMVVPASTPAAPPDALTKLITARDALPEGDPRRRLYDQAITKSTTHAPSASNNVSIITEKEEGKAVGKFFGEQYANIQTAAMQGQAKVNNLVRINQLLEGVETGRLTPLGTELASVAQSLGINIDKNLGNKQAAAALGNEIALQMRNPAGGAGMPGAMSDKDREFLVSMVPGLAMTKEGRKQMIETATKLAKRDREVAAMARTYRQKNGTIDEGFQEQISRFADANPLFSGASAGPNPGAVQDGYRFKGGNPADAKNWVKVGG